MTDIDELIERRRRIVADCRTAGTRDLLLLAEAIERQSAGDDISIDDFLGWGWAARLGARNQKLCEVHQQFFPADLPTTAAKKIVRLARDLKRANTGTLEKIGLDDPRRLIVQAMKTGLAFPKERQLFNILAMQ